MGPLPKHKISRARRGERRNHLGIVTASLVTCPQCHSPKLPHRVCPTCGTYNGREVVKIESRKGKTG